jgi:hypothetical protein
MEAVAIPKAEWRRIVKILERMEKQTVEWIDEDEACRLLGREGKPLKTETLYTYTYTGKIPPSFYRTSPVNGKRFYDKEMLMGLR